MPRDSSGNYSLPVGNPVVAGTVIEDTWANPTMADIAAQLNNVLTRDGLLGPTTPVKFADGTVLAPGITFLNAASTGIYRESTQMSVSWNGVRVGGFNASGFVGNVAGNVTGNVTGDVTGHVTGTLTGDVVGHASLDLRLTGGTITGNLALRSAAPQLIIDSNVADNYAFIQFTRTGVLRWSWVMSNEAESGGNAGSNFQLLAYSDTGTILSSSISIPRATGIPAFPNGIAGNLTGHASLDLPLGGGTLTGSLTAPTFIGALTGHASLDLPLTGGSLSGLLTASILYDNSSSGITSNRVQGAITELKSDINLLQSNLTYAGNLGYNQPDPPDPVSGSPYYIFETGGLRTVGDIAGTTVSIGDWLIWEATTLVWGYLAYGSKTVIASDVNYSNSASGLTATNVQGAIDEVDAKADTITNYLPKTGGTLTGNLTVNANSPYINLTKKTTGDYAGVQWTLNSVPQWFVYSNASADSSWNLARYDDAGVTAGTALSVNRGTGAVTVAAGIIGTLTGHASLDLPLTGGTLTGNLTLGGSSPTVSLNAAAGEYSFLNYNRSSSRRFSLIMSNEPETGSNAGSNMQLLSYTDTGAYLSSILAINRATGAMTVTQPIIGALTGHASLDLPLTGGSLTGTLYIAPTSNNPALALREAADSGLGANLYYQNGGLNRWTLNMTAGAETVGDNGADFTIQRFGNSGAFLGEVLTITRATGTTVIRAPYLYVQNATDHATIVVTAPAGKNAGFSLSGDAGVPFTDGYDIVNTSGGTTIANYRGAGGFIGNVQGKEVMRLTSAGITGPINGLGQVPVSTAVGTSRPLSAVDFDQGVMPLTAAITITVPSIASMALPSTPGKLRVLAFQITSAGIPTFVAGVGVTINGTTNATVLPLNGAPRRYQFVVLTQMSPDSDFWSLS